MHHEPDTTDVRRNFVEYLTHFPAIAVSKTGNPVRFPSGRATFVTKPLPTGSPTNTNTIGTVRVSRCTISVTRLELVTITSGRIPTSSLAKARALSGSLPAQRVSIRTLPSSVQPSSRTFCRNAATLACPCVSSSLYPTSKPTRFIRSDCCARTTSGHAEATPHRTVMNSRRLMFPQTAKVDILPGQLFGLEG